MAQNMNVAVVTGNLTRDPEHKIVGQDLSVCELSIAVNGREKRNGEWVDRVEFIEATCFGNQADNCQKYLSKGKPVAVHGRLKQDRWEDKDTGKGRSKLYIVASSVQFLESRSEEERRQDTSHTAAADPSGNWAGMAKDDDDIPFARPSYPDLFDPKLRHSNRGPHRSPFS